ncbi:hypothetical protein G6045_21515 [Streptomyces sp. YC504]|uniref:DUF11 domain-containing protein n=1 Tax=Streptomyces mesophilus TaxID=1775132 RepID=A0A6G4XNM8_9ACTN|nr:hypothetical protein [Streptomyces mesophilus]NGO78221.1 hypothetical protein [Streptomyces mesophilus]
MPPTHRRSWTRSTVRRGALSAAAAVACLVAGAATSFSAPRGTAVDLAIADVPLQVSPGKSGVQKLIVSNAGARPTTGPALVSYATPAYTNIDRGRPLPRGCKIAYANPDPVVPEVVVCRLPAGLAKGRDTTLAVPVVVTERARLTGTIRGRSSVLPAPESKDTESDANNNWTLARLNLTRPTPAPPAGNRVGLWIAQSDAVVEQDGTAELELRYGNVGPNASDSTVVVFTTPLLTKVDTEGGLPDGCAFELDDKTPGIPQIVRCTLDGQDVEEDDSLTVPLVAQPGVPKGMTAGSLLVAPAKPCDVDTDQTDNLTVAVVRVPSRAS